MTNEQKNDHEDYALAGEVSVEEAREALQRFVNSHFDNPGEKARASIPADPRRDDDIRLGAFIARAEKAFAELKRLRIACDALVEAWDEDEDGLVDVAIVATLRRSAR